MASLFSLAPTQWHRLRQHLDDALALPPEARAAWLEGLQGDAAELRPQLAELLQQAAAQLNSTTPDALERGPVVPGPSRPQPLMAGAQVGPYQLRSLLGRGGMGEVWLAERTDMLQNRRVALKLPRGADWRRGMDDRLAREREILATLEHPHIARLYEAGLDSQGQPYIALEFVDGLRIDEYAEQHGLGITQRLELFLQVCDAVAHAHGRLVVHRDLKPANILVDRQGQVKLLDFGIARLLEAGAAPAGDLTREYGNALTPRYAAPEQLSGQILGTAADIYVLGLVLLELLVGRAALDAAWPADQVSGGQGLGETLRRPSEMSPVRSVRDALRGDLDTIVGKALRPEPSARYATVDALAADLRRHLAHQPVLARPASRAYLVQRFARRHRWGVASATALLASVLVGAALSLWQADEARQQRDLALEARAEADEATSRARWAQQRAQAQSDYGDFLLSDAAQGQSNEVSSAQLERSLAFVRGQYRHDAAQRAELLADVAMRLRWIGRDQRAAELFAEAEPLLRASGQFDGVARVLCVRARDLAQRGRFEEGRQVIAEARAALARAKDPSSPTHAGCRLEEAALARLAGSPDEAVRLTESAWEHERAAGRSERQFAVAILMSLSRAQMESGQPAAAARTARQGLETTALVGHEFGPALWQAWGLLGVALREGGQNQAALQAFAGEGRGDGADTRRSPAARLQFATTLSLQGRHGEALEVLERAREEVLASGSASQRRSLAVRVASAQLASGRWQAAGQTLMAIEPEFAKPRAQQQLAARPYLLALAEWRLQANRPLDAEAALRELQANLKAHPASDDSSRGQQRLSARLALQQDRLDLALTAANEALAISQRLAIDPQASLQLGEDLLLRARVHERRGQAGLARGDAQAARHQISNAAGSTHGLVDEADELLGRLPRAER
jgi:eukaryotic-like serine/threonine-protein kinase